MKNSIQKICVLIAAFLITSSYSAAQDLTGTTLTLEKPGYGATLVNLRMDNVAFLKGFDYVRNRNVGVIRFFPTTWHGGQTPKGAGSMNLYGDRSVTIGSDYNNFIAIFRNSDGYVGIGTANPSERLEVSGNVKATAFIGDGSQLTNLPTAGGGTIWSGSGNIFYNSGDVGIGTSSPNYKLDVAGDVYANGGWMRVSGNKGVFFQSYGGGLYMKDNSWIRTYGNKNFYHNTGIMRTDGSFQVGSGGDRFIVNGTGEVGIGNVSPSEKLEVSGNVKATAFIGDGSQLTNLPSSGGSVWSGSSDISYMGGNVGIGVDNPSNELEVDGDVSISGSLGVTGFGIGAPWIDLGWTSSNLLTVRYLKGLDSNQLRARIGINYHIEANDITQKARKGSLKAPVIELDAELGSVALYGENGSGADFRSNVNDYNLGVFVAGDGKVGIGNDNPSYGLDVNGTINSTDGNSMEWNTAFLERGSQIAGSGLTWAGGVLNVELSPNNYWTASGDYIQYDGDLRLKSGATLDDDATIGGHNDDWIKLNGFIEIKSNTDSYGIVLRDKDSNGYLGITNKNGWSYLANGISDNYFLRGNGANAEVRGDFTVRGGDVRDNSGSLRLSGEDNVFISMDYNNNDDENRSIRFGKNDEGTDANWSELMRIDEDGKVGIGSSNPDEMLTVNGTVHSTEVLVELTVPGPDYVFESDYELPSLKEIEQFVKKEKHLPEVPSAKEMEEDGIKVSEMNMLLLKKIEELTLYQIELLKRIEKLEEENKD